MAWWTYSKLHHENDTEKKATHVHCVYGLSSELLENGSYVHRALPPRNTPGDEWIRLPETCLLHDRLKNIGLILWKAFHHDALPSHPCILGFKPACAWLVQPTRVCLHSDDFLASLIRSVDYARYIRLSGEGYGMTAFIVIFKCLAAMD